MPTEAQRFYLRDQDHDDTWGTDVRRLNEARASEAPNDDTKANFGTNTAQGRIVLDPFTTRSTRGLDDEDLYGWAVDDADMDSTATARRVIPSGDWTFHTRLTATVAQSGIGNDTTRVTAVVYRVAADGTRTELFREESAAVAVPSGISLVTVEWTSNQSGIVLEADETILASFQLLSVGKAVTGQTITFRTLSTTNENNNVWVLVPPPGIRTDYPQTVTVNAVGTATRAGLEAALSRTVGAVGTATMTRTVDLNRTVTVNAVGTASVTKTITKADITVGAVATVTGRIEVPLDEIPDTSDFSGSDPTAAIGGTVFDRSGDPVSGATVKLFRQSDDVKVAETTSAGDGTYSFTRDTADPNSYYLVAFTDDEVHGTSDRSLTPE